MDKIKLFLAHAATLTATIAVALGSLSDALLNFSGTGNTETEVIVGIIALGVAIVGIYHRIVGK